ncbi:MAG: GNAT family N-acetyltransferase [Anaerolineaceae bacterium]|nr:GNAT family N-acetyltransferase [Anaerolineaceae bacterium]
MESILLDLPDQIETERLLIRVPRPGDGQAIFEAVKESHPRLKPWFPWAQKVSSREEYEIHMRKQHANFLLKTDMMLLLFLKETGKLIGSSGLHPRGWEVPKFEIGYWIRTGYEGKGYVIEAVEGITRFGFETVGAKRIMIRCDERNIRSQSVAKRAGYLYEGMFRNYEPRWDGDGLTNMMYFAMTETDYNLKTLTN